MFHRVVSTVRSLAMGTLLVSCSMKPTPTHDIKEAAEAAANDPNGARVNPNTVSVTTLNDAFSNPVYTCNQHRDVHETKPGKCPKCGLEMVVEKKGEGAK